MQSSPAQQHTPEDQYNKNALAEVIPGLWIGSLEALKEIRKIPRSWTVISVLNTARAREFAKECLDETENDAVQVEKHVEWELPDHSQANFLSPRLDDILRIIDSAIKTSSETNHPRACLVHCAFGISRSASVVAAWLLSRRKFHTLEETMKILRCARPKASPNMGFVAMLRALEQCEGDISAAMERMNRQGAG